LSKVKVSLLEFFRTGMFGPLYLGMDINRLEDIIGNPTDYDSLELWLEGEKRIADPSGIPPAVNWFWVDYIQFGFTDGGKVEDIYTDYLERLKPQGTTLTLDLWVFEDDKTPHKDKVIAELAKEKIHFHVLNQNYLA